MAEGRVQRRLAAVLAIDVVGYSRLMERDEVGAPWLRSNPGGEKFFSQ
jgi:class 3 adenylate cyclase